MPTQGPEVHHATICRDAQLSSPIRAIEVGKVCVWAADLPAVLPFTSHLLADIDSLLRDGKQNKAAYGIQTETMLQTLTSRHWKVFFSEVRRVMTAIIEESPELIAHGRIHLRAWASRLEHIDDENERRLRLQALHNHSPAFLSSVYYLKVPEGLSGGDGGTMFVNPFPHSIASPRPGLVVPSSEGRIVVFPSWLLHGPALLEHRHLQSPRIVIAVDAHLVPE